MQAGQFGAILMFGPAYHLISDNSIALALRQVRRLRQPAGKLFVTFLTRTSMLKDLLKRWRWSPIRALLDSGYLESGICRPRSESSKHDYMSPARTYGYQEAVLDLLTSAAFEVRPTHFCEGFAAFMRPYVESAAREDGDFTQVLDCLFAASTYSASVEDGDHFLIVPRLGPVRLASRRLRHRSLDQR